MPIRTELHCHNSFSNFQLGSDEPPYDCDVSVREQLERSYSMGLDAIFVTNHNTLDGYLQMLEYKRDHEKFTSIGIYPAEEITIDKGAHVLAYGIRESIPFGTSLDDVIDAVHAQGGVVSAPHPFSLIDALRESAARCDMIEVFNSNNVDVLSNVRATQFALEKNMIAVSGSDSHTASTMGRCVNLIDAENDLDSILHAMNHKKITIGNTDYVKQDETLEHIRYKVNNSHEYISEYLAEYYPNTKRLFEMLLKLYDYDQNSRLWGLIYKLSVCLMKRISHKVNFQGQDPSFMKNRNLSAMIKMSL